MNEEQRLVQKRLRVLEHAKKTGNVRKTAAMLFSLKPHLSPIYHRFITDLSPREIINIYVPPLQRLTGKSLRHYDTTPNAVHCGKPTAAITASWRNALFNIC